LRTFANKPKIVNIYRRGFCDATVPVIINSQTLEYKRKVIDLFNLLTQTKRIVNQNVDEVDNAVVAMIVSPAMVNDMYSIRMRASHQGKHLTGAERIVAVTDVSVVVAELMERAVDCSTVLPEEIHCSSEKIDPTTIRYQQLPDLSTCQVKDWQAGRHLALRLLIQAGVSEEVAASAIQLLADGAGPGGHVMRGAVIMDVASGLRLEDDPARGVRVSRMDLTTACRVELEETLTAIDLGHHRVREALVLAGKVLSSPGLLAELCWSDSPDYVVGYVSSPQEGYQRISALKPEGDARGGRVFFVDSQAVSLTELVAFLERQPVLFNSLGTISAPEEWIEDNG
jgi:6-carboxyhexanoate--CoA ligase